MWRFFVTGLLGSFVLLFAGLGIATKDIFPFLFTEWFYIETEDWALMAFLGLLSAAFFVGVARAYQIARPIHHRYV